MIEIKPHIQDACEIRVPGSKSLTHRILIAASLSNGTCTITNALKSEDTYHTLNALKQMGVNIIEENSQLTVQGTDGNLGPSVKPIYLGSSGTSIRLLTAVAALGQGTYRLTGSDQLIQRPIQDLLDGLKQIKVHARSINHNGCPPIEVVGSTIAGGQVALNCSTSSQFLSALLLIAPLTTEGIAITVTEGPVSKPYIDLTVDVMEMFGIDMYREDYLKFRIPGNQVYRAGTYHVEPDCSQASYFWAAAAISGAKVKVKGIRQDSRQGDIRFTEILGAMGCKIVSEPDGITVAGGTLSAVEVDMVDMPDMVPTLAVIAAYANGTTRIKNVAHLKAKESNRLGSVVNELVKMGIDAQCGDNDMTIRGGNPVGAEIETYGDHRMAMSFAVAGLMTPGIIIKDKDCVNKSFPTFWEVFEELHGK